MEAIPITNCSSTLPSLNQRPLPSKGVCRNLFGSVDHDEISSILESELHRDLKEKNEEWCFNFSEGTPLGHGRLVWEEIKQRTDDKLSTGSKESTYKESRVPDLHSEVEHSGDGVLEIAKNIRLQSEAITTTQSQKLPTSEPEILVSDSKVHPVVDRKRKRQCRTITDFMKQKKRRRVSYSSGAEKNCETKSLNDTRRAKDDITLGNSINKVKVSSKR